MPSSAKKRRHEAILTLVRTRRVHSQDEMRRILMELGFEVTQATLSRDLRELRVAKLPHADGESYYGVAGESDEPSPALDRLLPHLLVSAEGVGNLIVVKTLAGGANAVAESLDMEDWPEILGTIAGDDSILLVIRDAADRVDVVGRILRLAGR